MEDNVGRQNSCPLKPKRCFAKLNILTRIVTDRSLSGIPLLRKARNSVPVNEFSGVQLSSGLADAHRTPHVRTRSRVQMQHALAGINKVLFIPPVFHLLTNHLLIFCQGGPSGQKSAKICLMYVSGRRESQMPAICNK